MTASLLPPSELTAMTTTCLLCTDLLTRPVPSDSSARFAGISLCPQGNP